MGPQDPKDITQAIARDLGEIVSSINMARADATHWLKDANYEALRLRLEMAHAAAEAALVEARRRVRIDEGALIESGCPEEKQELLLFWHRAL